MLLDSFGYAGIQSMKLDDWESFGCDVLGFQLAEKTRTSLVFRVDDRKQRIIVEAAHLDRANTYGWQVADESVCETIAARLDSNNIAVQPMSRLTADQRMVGGGIVFDDPAGNHLEVFYRPDTTTEPFVPARNMSGFRTGPLGLGHVVLSVENLDAVLPFYLENLDFHISDWVEKPFRGYFLHTNQRHHSLAIFQLGKNNCHHLMVEALSLDDVGQCYDIAQSRKGTVNVTLGRHTNDFMTSYYANSPSGFLFECGWGGRSLDVESWEPYEMMHGASLWGHERAWQTPEMRDHAREQRLQAARDGLREPVQVIEGNYQLGPGVCPWFDSLKRQ